MATRQAAVLARRGATRILSSFSGRVGSAFASSSAESFYQAIRRDGILGAERGFATVVIMRRSAGLTELLIRFCYFSIFLMRSINPQIAYVEL